MCKGNRITGWNTIQKKGAPRRFPIGFSGFAFNSTMLWDPQRWNRPAMDSVIVHSGGRGGLQVSLSLTQTSYIQAYYYVLMELPFCKILLQPS